MTNPYGPPTTNVSEELDSRSRRFVARAWRGHEKLWRAYWLWHVLGVALLTAAIEFSDLIFENVQNATFLETLGWIFFAIWVAYILFSCVVVWRCAWNTRLPVFGVLVRAQLVLYAVIVALTIAKQVDPNWLRRLIGSRASTQGDFVAQQPPNMAFNRTRRHAARVRRTPVAARRLT